MPDPDLTLHDVAEALGVHYMTAYRYVRLGLLPARKVGSSWVISADDLAAFRTSRRDVPRGRAARGDGRWAERLEDRIVAGDAGGAWGVLEAAMAGGAELDDLYLDVVVPALQGLGDRWATGSIDVAVEHRASVIVAQLLARLAARASRRGRSRGAVVLGAAPGERHALPVTIVADLLRFRGFDVDDLGADVPASSFAAAAAAAVAESDRLVAVGISATTPGLEESVRAAIDAVRARLGSEVPLLVGGAALPERAAALALGADHWGHDGRDVVAIVSALAGGRSSTPAGR